MTFELMYNISFESLEALEEVREEAEYLCKEEGGGGGLGRGMFMQELIGILSVAIS